MSNFSGLIAGMKPGRDAREPSCAKCEDVGVYESPRNEWHECPRCRIVQKARAEQGGKDAGIPERHRERDGMKEFKARDDSDKDLLRDALAYVADFKKDSPGIILCGPVGTGKTYVAAAMATGLMKRQFRPIWWGVPALCDALRSSFDKDSETSSSSIIGEAQDADVLFLDDFGAEKSTEFVKEQLFLIINHRIEAQKPIVITTNSPEIGWRIAFGDRIASRLYEVAPKSNRIAVLGNDRRNS